MSCVTGFVVLALALLPAATASELGELEEVRRAHDAGEIVSLEKILTAVEFGFAGLVVEVELERDEGRLEYEVELLTHGGNVLEITYDAATGKMLEVEGTGIEAARKKP